MNITMLSLIIWAVLFFESCNSEGGFSVKGDHWMNDGNVPQTKIELYTFINTLRSEFEETYQLHDAAAMADRYTDDSVYIHQDLGILRGKQNVEKGFQNIFDSGHASVNVEFLKASDIGTFGDGYVHAIAREHFFDKDNNEIGQSTVLVILKPVADGYKHYLKTEFTD